MAITHTNLIKRARSAYAKALAQLDADHPRRTARRLTPADFPEQAIRDALVERGDDEEIGVTLYGGFVPNSYNPKGASNTDRAQIYVGDRDAYATAERNPNGSRSHGRGSTVIVRLRRAEQSLGRIFHSE